MPAPEQAPPQIPAQLAREWALCGIAAAAARFIPVPLLDDAVRSRAMRLAVTRTLRLHGRELPADAVEPLWEGTGGVLADVRRWVVGVPTRVLLFPVRKYIMIFGAVRGVPTDVMTVILLGRAVHHTLQRGGLTGTDRKALRREAVAIRGAFDDAVAGMDLRVLSSALGEALSTGRGLSSAALGYARRRFGGADGPWVDATDKPEGPGAGPRAADPGREDVEVERGADYVVRVLHRPEVEQVLQRFDARLVERLARARGR